MLAVIDHGTIGKESILDWLIHAWYIQRFHQLFSSVSISQSRVDSINQSLVRMRSVKDHKILN